MNFLDLLADVSDDTDEDLDELTEEGQEPGFLIEKLGTALTLQADRAFVAESEIVDHQHAESDSLTRLLRRMDEWRAQGRQEQAEAESIAQEYQERARKRRRIEPSQIETETHDDALQRHLGSSKQLLGDGLDIDDSEYEMYMIRVRNVQLVPKHTN